MHAIGAKPRRSLFGRKLTGLKATFGAMDKDSSGSITHEEFRKARLPAAHPTLDMISQFS